MKSVFRCFIKLNEKCLSNWFSSGSCGLCGMRRCPGPGQRLDSACRRVVGAATFNVDGRPVVCPPHTTGLLGVFC